jgi:glycosyltransferase involved in cell wall biosynthesis
VNQYYPSRRKIYNTLVEPQVKRCIKELNQVYCQARYTIKKARTLFDLDYDPGFLPNPVIVPDKLPEKSGDPTVLFLGRLDGEKKPEEFMHLAERFPDVKFIAAGASHDPEYDRMLRRKYEVVPNLRLTGFIDGLEKSRILDDSWILVNTSVSECLPVSFLEAAAHGCSILSPHDPDGFASRFGVHSAHTELEMGLRWLLRDENWREKGKEGHRYVKEHHEEKKVIEQHISEYRKMSA